VGTDGKDPKGRLRLKTITMISASEPSATSGTPAARWHIQRAVLVVLAGLLLLGPTGCSDKPDREPEPVAGPATPKVPTPPPADAAIDDAASEDIALVPVEHPKPKPPVADAYAEALLLHLRRRIQGEASSESDIRKAIEARAARLRRFRKLVVAAYTQRGFDPFISKGGKLTADGQLAIDLIVDVASHGLEPSPYPVKLLTAAQARLASANADIADAAPLTDDSALSKLVAIANEFEPLPGDSYKDQRARITRVLLKAGLSDDEPFKEQIKSLGAWWEDLAASRKEVSKALAEMDVFVAQGFLQYALDFKYLVVAHPFNAKSRDHIARAEFNFRRKLGAEFRQSGDKLGETMRGWWPRHPFYLKAKAALEKYQRLVDENLVPPYKQRGRLKKGMKGPKIIKLKARLAAEGYYSGDLADEKFGVDLVESVKRFQYHHQLREDGIVRNSYGLDGLTKTSLGVSMSRRVSSLKLSMQRWRESPTHQVDEPFYFRVNVPQFAVEVWEADELARRHRIIVGNNKFESDPDHGREGHLNRTALISDEIERVVLNPVWRVPQRIRIHEIMVAARKDPDYMEKHGYKTRILANGSEQVYQEAGKGNALGRVKFLFPNRHAIYMHDTPKRSLFKRTIRAYSHGCMRLEDPVDMAAYLLEREGLMSPAKVKEIIEKGKERGVRLKKKIPIHIEYNTVAFDADDDMPIFLNDVYKYDRAYYEGNLPLSPHKKIPIVKTEYPEDDEPDPRAADGEEKDDGTSPDDTSDVPLTPRPKPEALPTPDRRPATDRRPALDKLKIEKRLAPRTDRRIELPVKRGADRPRTILPPE
jgi:murein L,D-transpeptidase YcbB/YkuD